MIILSIDKVKTYFKQFNMEDKVMEFPVSSATVAEAAQALHCEEAKPISPKQCRSNWMTKPFSS